MFDVVHDLFRVRPRLMWVGLRDSLLGLRTYEFYFDQYSIMRNYLFVDWQNLAVVNTGHTLLKSINKK